MGATLGPTSAELRPGHYTGGSGWCQPLWVALWARGSGLGSVCWSSERRPQRDAESDARWSRAASDGLLRDVGARKFLERFAPETDRFGFLHRPYIVPSVLLNTLDEPHGADSIRGPAVDIHRLV